MINGNKIEVNDPILKFKKEEQELITEVQANLDKEGKIFSTKYITEKSYGEKEWNEWLAKAENLKAKDMEKVYNDAQKRYDGK